VAGCLARVFLAGVPGPPRAGLAFWGGYLVGGGRASPRGLPPPARLLVRASCRRLLVQVPGLLAGEGPLQPRRGRRLRPAEMADGGEMPRRRVPIPWLVPVASQGPPEPLLGLAQRQPTARPEDSLRSHAPLPPFHPPPPPPPFSPRALDPPPPVPPAAPPAAVSPATARPAPPSFGPGFRHVDRQPTATGFLAVQRGDCRLGLLLGLHFHEAEALGLS